MYAITCMWVLFNRFYAPSLRGLLLCFDCPPVFTEFCLTEVQYISHFTDITCPWGWGRVKILDLQISAMLPLGASGFHKHILFRFIGVLHLVYTYTCVQVYGEIILYFPHSEYYKLKNMYTLLFSLLIHVYYWKLVAC